MSVVTLAAGIERPVGKILCVGRNYLAHAREMGDERPTEPLLFLKPPTALLVDGAPLHLPGWAAEVEHEVELVVRLGRGGRDLTPGEAASAVDAAGVGLDLTARDVQKRAKQRGHPWTVAKGFDGSAPLSPLVPRRELPPFEDLEISLEVNGELRQQGAVRLMLWSVPELLSFASTRMTLEPGDLVFTGTPEGVGPVHSGDHLLARLGPWASLELTVA